MEWPDVERRIGAGEDARTEFKRGIGDMRGVGKTLCAFANGEGGLLVIGVDDTGEIVGVAASADAVQERLTGLLHTGCGKPVTAQCGRHDTGGGWVHWIDVHRHQRGYEPFSYDGRFWIRRGRATVAPSPSELQELLNAFGFVLTENQVVPSASADDIDFGAVRALEAAGGPGAGHRRAVCRPAAHRSLVRDPRRERAHPPPGCRAGQRGAALRAGAQPAGDSGAGGRRRPACPARHRLHHLPGAVRHGQHLQPRLAGTDGARHGVRDTRPGPDGAVRPGPGRDPRPALRPLRGELRRGPLPGRPDGPRHGARVTGYRPDPPEQRPYRGGAAARLSRHGRRGGRTRLHPHGAGAARDAGGGAATVARGDRGGRPGGDGGARRV